MKVLGTEGTVPEFVLENIIEKCMERGKRGKTRPGTSGTYFRKRVSARR